MKRLLLLAATALAPALAHAQSTYPYGVPYYPTYGSPNSVQMQVLQVGLNLEDITDEGEDRFTEAGDSDTIGVAATRWSGDDANGDRIDLHYQKAWRPFAGSRARLLLDIPISALTVDHESGTAYLGSVNLGLEIPLKSNWTLTPRVAYGQADAPDGFSGNGELAAASVTSRYRIAQIGRGDLVIGDMVGYTSTVRTGLNSQPFWGGPDTNWAFRNGIAYQLPLETRLFGRQASFRISYVNTELTGDFVGYSMINEVAANIGVRLREANAKTNSDLLRFGVLYTWADNYKALTLTLGYRF
jgi:hypothetical protein